VDPDFATEEASRQNWEAIGHLVTSVSHHQVAAAFALLGAGPVLVALVVDFEAGGADWEDVDPVETLAAAISDQESNLVADLAVIVLLIEEVEFLAYHQTAATYHQAGRVDQAPWVMAVDQGFEHLVPVAVEVVGVD